MRTSAGIVTIATHMLAQLQFEYTALPLFDHLEKYRTEGMPVGDFLTALLSNELGAAVDHADDTNKWLLPIYRTYLYNEMPGTAHGSREKVTEWLAMHRRQREVRNELEAMEPISASDL